MVTLVERGNAPPQVLIYRSSERGGQLIICISPLAPPFIIWFTMPLSSSPLFEELLSPFDTAFLCRVYAIPTLIHKMPSSAEIAAYLLSEAMIMAHYFRASTAARAAIYAPTSPGWVKIQSRLLLNDGLISGRALGEMLMTLEYIGNLVTISMPRRSGRVCQYRWQAV